MFRLILWCLLALSTDISAKSIIYSNDLDKQSKLSILLPEVPDIVEFDSKKQEFQGPGVDMTREIARRSGIKLILEIYPFERALLLTQERNNTCTPITRATVKHLDFKWSDTIIRKNIVFFVKHNSTLKLDRLQQARNLRIGALKGSIISLKLKRLGFKVEESTDPILGLRKLARGRLDIWTTIDIALLEYSKKAGIRMPKKLFVVGSAECMTDLALASMLKTNKQHKINLNNSLPHRLFK